MGLVLTPDEEKSLAIRAREGDRAAFDQLVSATARRVYATVYRLTGCVEDAKDLTQETFLRVYRSLSTWQPDRPFSPWLYRIATNAALDHLRSQRGELTSLEEESAGSTEAERLT
jgi:RNA polymerase sigma-70 factor, ECF subfamily